MERTSDQHNTSELWSHSTAPLQAIPTSSSSLMKASLLLVLVVAVATFAFHIGDHEGITKQAMVRTRF